MPKLTLISLLCATCLAACSLPAPAPTTPTLDLALVGTIAAMTLQAIPTQTQIPVSTATLVLSPTLTQTPTITPTFTTPMLQFEGNTNCRLGPGTGYDVVTVVFEGQKAQAIGVSEEGNYWLVINPDKGDNCWVAKDFVKPSGSILALPTVIAPPTPTPVPPKPPVWSNYTFTCDFASGGSNLTMNLAWTDRSNNEEGFVIYRDGQPVANLGPDMTTYVDVAFVEAGKSLTYTVEVYNKSGRASSSPINAACQ